MLFHGCLVLVWSLSGLSFTCRNCPRSSTCLRQPELQPSSTVLISSLVHDWLILSKDHRDTTWEEPSALHQCRLHKGNNSIGHWLGICLFQCLHYLVAESIRWGLMDSGLLTQWFITVCSSLHPSHSGETSENRCSCKSSVNKTRIRGVTAATEGLTADIWRSGAALRILCVLWNLPEGLHSISWHYKNMFLICMYRCVPCIDNIRHKLSCYFRSCWSRPYP